MIRSGESYVIGAKDALRMALSTRERVQEVRLIHHSDRGSQYLSGDYTQTLADHDVLASVGSTGDAYDNSMEDAARKLIYLAIQNAVPQWTRTRGWTKALPAFKIHFGNRLPD
jgi:putative transposase